MKSSLHAVDDAPTAPGDSTADPALISHDLAGEAFADAFRRRVGRGTGKISVADLADALDIQPRTVRAWRDSETLPHWTAMLRLCCHFGPAFASEILGPAGLGGVEPVALVRADPDGTAADLVATAHDLLERLRDGTFCHRDRAAMAPKLLELSRALESQARAMGAR